MTNTLSVKERAEVARAVCGGDWFIDHGRIFSKDYAVWSSAHPLEFNPQFGNPANIAADDAWQRSQALALVEWLADRILNCKDIRIDNYRDAAVSVLQCLAGKDISALESLAHSMLEKKDG